MAEDFSDDMSVGLDATDLISGASSAAISLVKLNTEVDNLKDAFVLASPPADELKFSITRLDAAGNSLTKTFLQDAEGVKELSKSFKLATVNIGEQRSAIEAETDSLKRLTEQMERADRVAAQKRTLEYQKQATPLTESQRQELEPGTNRTKGTISDSTVEETLASSSRQAAGLSIAQQHLALVRTEEENILRLVGLGKDLNVEELDKLNTLRQVIDLSQLEIEKKEKYLSLVNSNAEKIQAATQAEALKEEERLLKNRVALSGQFKASELEAAEQLKRDIAVSQLTQSGKDVLTRRVDTSISKIKLEELKEEKLELGRLIEVVQHLKFAELDQVETVRRVIQGSNQDLRTKQQLLKELDLAFQKSVESINQGELKTLANERALRRETEERFNAQKKLTDLLNTTRDTARANFLASTGAGPPPRNPPTNLTGLDGEESVRRLGRTFEETGNLGTRAANGIIISWQNVWRLVQFQLIHTALRDFIGALRESITTTEQFEIKISEIRTISQESGQSFQQVADSVRKLSDEFGNPVLDVAAGLYETISNQISKGAEAATFMASAQRFAATTNSSVANSVDLLSSAINSYHLSAGDAERVSAVFFKTIDLGRVRASELGGTIGRILPLASQLGIGLEEVAAGITTLTRNGAPASEAMTLLNNVFISLVHGRKDMREAIQNMGAESGPAAVQMYGLVGVLQKLEEQTRGSTSELANFFTNIRGLRGGIGLTGIGGQDFRKDLEQIKDSATAYQTAIGIIFESPGKELQIQLNKISNYIQHDFAEGSIAAIVRISHSLSDEGLSGAFKDLISIGKNALELYISYEAVTFAASGSTALMTAIVNAQNAAIAENARGLRLIDTVTRLKSSAQAQDLIASNLAIGADAKRAEMTVLNTAAIEAEAKAAQQLVEVEFAETVGSQAVVGSSRAAAEAHTAEAVAIREKIVAIEANIAADLESSAAASARAGVIGLEAEAITAQAISLASVSKESVLFGKALSGVGAFLSNPIVLLTAAIFITGKLITTYQELEEEQAKAFGMAVKAQEEANAKILENAKKLQADQEHIFEDGLTKQFASYTAYASKIIDRLEETSQAEKENLAEFVEIRKRTLEDYIRNYNDTTHRIETLEKQSTDNIRRLDQELNQDREKFQEDRFRRELQHAQHLDAMTAPGKAKLFDENQLKLVTDEFKRLDAVRQNLLKPLPSAVDLLINPIGSVERLSKVSFDPKVLEQNRIDARKVLDNEKSVAEDLLRRKDTTEEEQQRAKKDLDDTKAQIAEREAKYNATSDLTTQQRGLRPISGPKQRIDAERDEERDRERTFQKQKDDANLKDKQARYDASTTALKYLPQESELKQKLLDIERENVRLLQEEKSLNEGLKSLAAETSKDRESKFDKQRAELALFAKFKFDPAKIDTQAQLDEQIDKYQKLIDSSVQSGLKDTSLIFSFQQEEEKMRAAGNARLLELEKKHDLDKLAKDKQAMIQLREQRSAELSKINEDITKTFITPAAVLGDRLETESLTRRSLGSGQFTTQSGQIASASSIQMLRLTANDEKSSLDFMQSFKDLQANFNILKDQSKKSLESGGELDPKFFAAFQKGLAGFVAQVRPEELGFVIQGGQKDAKGNALPDITLGQEITRLQRFSADFQRLVSQRQGKFGELKDIDSQSKSITDSIVTITKSSGDLTKSFKDLSDEVQKIVTSFKQTNTFGPEALTNSITLGSTEQGPIPPSDFVPSAKIVLPTNLDNTDGSAPDRHTYRVSDSSVNKLQQTIPVDFSSSKLEVDDSTRTIPIDFKQSAFQFDNSAKTIPVDFNSSKLKFDESAKTIPIDFSANTLNPVDFATVAGQSGINPTKTLNSPANYGNFAPTIEPFNPTSVQTDMSTSSTMNFGDINVTLHSIGNQKMDAKQLAKDIQRELRLTGASLGPNQMD